MMVAWIWVTVVDGEKLLGRWIYFEGRIFLGSEEKRGVKDNSKVYELSNWVNRDIID